MIVVSEDEKRYWRELRKYGYSYDAIARKSLDKFGLKRSRSVIHKYSHDVDRMLEDESVQWTLPRFTVSKKTRLRAAGLIERHDMDLDDILETSLDAFELMRDMNLRHEDLVRTSALMERLQESGEGAEALLLVVDLLNCLEDEGMEMEDFSRLLEYLKMTLSADIGEGVIVYLPEILQKIGRLKMEGEDILFVLGEMAGMEGLHFDADTLILLMKELNLEKMSGKSSEQACADLTLRVETKLGLETAIEGAKEELESLEEDIAEKQDEKRNVEGELETTRIRELKRMESEIAEAGRRKAAINEQLVKANLRFLGKVEEADRLARFSEEMASRLKETKIQVQEKEERLDSLTCKVDEQKRWLQDNEVYMGIGKAFLALVASQGQSTRDEIRRYAERIVEACSRPSSVKDFKDRITALSEKFRVTVFTIIGKSIGFFDLVSDLQSGFESLRVQLDTLKQENVALKRENVFLKSRSKSDEGQQPS